jgi:hypothetical protein
MGTEGRLAAASRSIKSKTKPVQAAAEKKAAAEVAGAAGPSGSQWPKPQDGTMLGLGGAAGGSRPSSGGESDDGDAQERKKQTAAERKAQAEREALAVVAPQNSAEYAAKQLLRREQPPGSRLWQIVEWLLGDDDGECMIVLDECHRAKNLVSKAGASTKTGLAIHALQNALPNARVLYSSATGASEPLNMAYMTRLLPPGFKDTFDMVGTLQVSWTRAVLWLVWDGRGWQLELEDLVLVKCLHYQKITVPSVPGAFCACITRKLRCLLAYCKWTRRHSHYLMMPGLGCLQNV